MARTRSNPAVLAVGVVAVGLLLSSCAVDPGSDTQERTIEPSASGAAEPSDTATAFDAPEATAPAPTTESSGQRENPADDPDLAANLLTSLDTVETVSTQEGETTPDGDSIERTAVWDYTRTPVAARVESATNGATDPLVLVMLDGVTYISAAPVAPGRWVTYEGAPPNLDDPITRVRELLSAGPEFTDVGRFESRGVEVTALNAIVTIPDAVPSTTTMEVYLEDDGGLHAIHYSSGLASGLIYVEDPADVPAIEAPPAGQVLSDQEARDLGLVP
ncbi:hypothetical protein [Litorihabitans aurantiacus]|uniref:Uncharacterized protein n=1 Tax=Litorihabitans aurantiacus TaxID=1930061 RepID=A0AA37XI23_9MICO|nr:hypothetical protein [Litorihabitans aurantiacus]GMA33419.1 hypothetical protein GCM10025875_34110 [Litorihabitans aurantiacus]